MCVCIGIVQQHVVVLCSWSSAATVPHYSCTNLPSLLYGLLMGLVAARPLR